MKTLKNFLCSLGLLLAVLFAGAFAACGDVSDLIDSSKDSEGMESPIKVTAVYEQSTQVFSDTPLDDLRADLTVTLETSAETLTEIEDYTLSGTLAIGESVVTVTYNPVPALTATFNVNVSEGNVHTHTFTNYISDNNAECEKNGTKTAKCDYDFCQATDIVEDEGTALSHSFINYVSDNNATCEADGTKTANCDNGCDKTDVITDEGTALAHIYTNYVSDGNATCTKDGTKTAVCDNGCGKTDKKTDEGSKISHVFENYVSNNDAACEKDGTKTGTCKYGCGKTDVVTDVGSALIHTYTNYVSDGNATCTKDGTKTAVCDNGCGKTDKKTDEGSKIQHVFENYVSNNDAACEKDGTKTGTCKYGCGVTEKVTDVGSALSHTYTNYVNDNNATCEENGTKTATCDNGCGKTDVLTIENSAIGHDFTDYVSDNNATCEADGTKTANCNNGCGKTKTVTDVGSALGHSYTNYVSDNNATCEADGTKTANCDNGCDKTKTVTDVGSIVAHAYENYVSNNDATCEADGTKTGTCKYGCGTTDVTTDVGSRLQHAYENYVSNNDATCEADGTKTGTCKYGCGTTDVTTDVGSRLQHAYENYVSNNDATCEADGTKTGTCKYGCGTTDVTTDVGSRLQHVYTNYVSNNDATCEADGTKTATCDNGCGKEDIITIESSALGHSYTNYASDNNATCEADGTKTANCNNGCGKTKTVTDVGSIVAHAYENYVSNNDATCEADGTKTGICKYGCGETKTVADVGSRLQHVYTNYVSNNDATCEADGTKTGTCKYGCGTTDVMEDAGSALGHNFKLSVCERCPKTNALTVVTVPSVTSIYYGEQPTFTDGVVQNELGETISSGTWSVSNVNYLASGTTQEIATTATVTFKPAGTEYASVSKEIALTLLAVAKYGDNCYATVDGALAKANESNSGTVYALPLGYDIDSGRAKIAKTIAEVTEIKSGVTLTLPYAENKLDTTVSYVNVSGSSYKTSAYRNTEYLKNQIYIAAENTLDNMGQINVAGEVSGGQYMNYNAGAYANSVTAGRHAQINLGANAKLTSTGTVNCYGFINEEEENNGSEFIVEKGNVTVMFTIVEYRGGQRYFGMIDPSNPKVKDAITSAAISGATLGSESKNPGKYTPDTLQASPFNRFYIESVTAKTTIKSNAQMLGHVVLFADSDNQQTTLRLINNNDAIIALTNQESSVTYKYDYSNHKMDLDIYGNMKLNPLELTIMVVKSEYGVTTAIELTLTTGATGDSSGVFFPISNYFDISLNAVNGSATVDASEQKVKLLPGSILTIGKGVVVNASEIAVYANNNLFIAREYYKEKTPAQLTVHGTLNVQAIGGEVRVGDDGARLKISQGTSVISKEIQAMAPSKTVPMTVLGITVNLPYVNVDYFSEEESMLIATGVTVNGDPLGVNEYTAQDKKWAPANITVGLKFNGGTASETSKTFGYGYQLKESDLPVPQREYYDFMGWYTTGDFVDGTRLEAMALTNDLTLYAKWQQKAGIVLVEFKAVETNVNDVEKTKTFGSQAINENSKYAVEPTKAVEYNQDTAYARYVVGYYLDEACTLEFDFAQELTENTTVYVKWGQKVKITISATGSSTNSVTADGNNVSATVFYVKPDTQIAVSATVSGGFLSTKKATVSGGGQEDSQETPWYGGSATASITFKATGETTISITAT